MIRLDDPTYQNWDQDRAAVEDHYAAQQPETVAADLSRAANKLASDFEASMQRAGDAGEGEATAPPSQSRPSVSMRCTTSCIISKR